MENQTIVYKNNGHVSLRLHDRSGLFALTMDAQHGAAPDGANVHPDELVNQNPLSSIFNTGKISVYKLKFCQSHAKGGKRWLTFVFLKTRQY